MMRRQITLYRDCGWARVEDPRIPGWAWVGLFRQDDGRVRVGTLVVDQQRGRVGNPGAGLPITAEVLRAVNVAEVEREANRHADELGDLDGAVAWSDAPGHDPVTIIRRTLGGTDSDPTYRPRGAAGRQYRLTGSPPPGRIPDEYLRRVVRAYHSAVEHGQAPAPAIAESTGASVNTVRSWVKKARQRGLMPPGRAGYTG